ncbi:hypothetical protein RJT34_02874 [Clitoria ternatea]|uniref:Uncharacterized protein n=1 Tax=Clitoria ternatea TaxID=43366 RepID=A0AAN9KHV0_CLITE
MASNITMLSSSVGRQALYFKVAFCVWITHAQPQRAYAEVLLGHVALLDLVVIMPICIYLLRPFTFPLVNAQCDYDDT